ncbi:transposase [Parachlamydia sp. AcF125]|uniref:transposase n=1 Tax=Parachlamydia sp. AcF125 TaxID=2795736 RepID=UPI001BC91A34|nr:transposase [Parachlamydia sp. AcF125]MBS4169002.1 hypothetical protein [Parachlamydia sp. AcF125]
MRASYGTDLSDAEWNLIKHLVEKPRVGFQEKYSRKEILNAIFYITRTGCQWRNLPHDFPPWQTVYGNFRNWETTGVFEQINTALREQLRIKRGRDKEATGTLIDSQAAKTTEKGGLVAVTVRPKRYLGGKDIFSLIRKACSYKQKLLLDIQATSKA